MTKKQLAKKIVEMEYTKEELEQDKGLAKSRYNDLMKYNKSFLEERIIHLGK